MKEGRIDTFAIPAKGRNDAAAYAASIAEIKGGKNDLNRVQEAQAYKLRSLLGNPFEGDEEADAKKMVRGLQP